LFILDRGLPEGYLGVAWGFGGVNLTEPPRNPLSTPSKLSFYLKWEEYKNFIGRRLNGKGKNNEHQIRISFCLQENQDLYLSTIRPVKKK